MPRRIESLFVAGPAGRLEALLEEPEDREAIAAAVVCHPHPLHGGTLHNKVVYRVARGLRQSGHVVLRFNFRGVNLSEGKHAGGVGEVDDAEAALEALRERYPGLPFTIAGFSFGSRVGLFLAQRRPEAQRAIVVGFPATYGGNEALREAACPRIFIHSAKDTICPVEPMREFYESLPGEKRLIFVDGADHFFAGALDKLESVVAGLG